MLEALAELRPASRLAGVDDFRAWLAMDGITLDESWRLDRAGEDHSLQVARRTVVPPRAHRSFPLVVRHRAGAARAHEVRARGYAWGHGDEEPVERVKRLRGRG